MTSLNLLTQYLGDSSDDEKEASPRKRSRSRSPVREPEPAVRHTGTVTRWNETTQYGFIKVDSEEHVKEIFIHHNGITDGNNLKVGGKVEFEIVFDKKKGKSHAAKLTGGYTPNKKEIRMLCREAAKTRGECVAFRDGNCKKGESCRFKHVECPESEKDPQQYTIYRCPRWDDGPDAPVIVKHRPGKIV